MGIAENTGQPHIGSGHLDTQLFTQLAYQCLVGGFADLYFPAGKFPVPCPDFVGRALGEEEGTILPLQHGSGDFNDIS